MTRLRGRAYQQNLRDGTDPKLSASRNGQDGSCPQSDSGKHGEIGKVETAQTHNLLPGGTPVEPHPQYEDMLVQSTSNYTKSTLELARGH